MFHGSEFERSLERHYRRAYWTGVVYDTCLYWGAFFAARWVFRRYEARRQP